MKFIVSLFGDYFIFPLVIMDAAELKALLEDLQF